MSLTVTSSTPASPPKQKDAARTRDQVLSMGSAQFISAGFGIVYSILTARGLGPALRGELFIAQAYLMTANMLLGLSVSTIMTVQVSRGDFEAAEVHTSAVLFSLLFGACGAFAALLLFLHTAAFAGPWSWALGIYFLSLPALLYKALWSGVILGLGRIGLLSVYTVLDTLLIALGAGLVLYAFHWGLPGLFIMLAAEAVGIALLAYMLFARISPRKWHFSYWCIKNLWRQGSQQQLATIIGQLYFRADAFILAHFLTPVALGEYAIARGISDRITLAFTPIAQVMFPHISSKDPEASQRCTRLTFRQLAGLGIVLSIALTIAMRPFIYVMYGSAYRDAVLLADLLCVALIIRSITVPIELWFVGGLLKPGMTAISSTFMLVAVTVSGCVLTSYASGIGMAWAVLLSFTLSLGFTIWLANRQGLGLTRLLPHRRDLRSIFEATVGLWARG